VGRRPPGARGLRTQSRRTRQSCRREPWCRTTTVRRPLPPLKRRQRVRRRTFHFESRGPCRVETILPPRVSAHHGPCPTTWARPERPRTTMWFARFALLGRHAFYAGGQALSRPSGGKSAELTGVDEARPDRQRERPWNPTPMPPSARCSTDEPAPARLRRLHEHRRPSPANYLASRPNLGSGRPRRPGTLPETTFVFCTLASSGPTIYAGRRCSPNIGGQPAATGLGGRSSHHLPCRPAWNAEPVATVPRGIRHPLRACHLRGGT